jgi:hypothetical protein
MNRIILSVVTLFCLLGTVQCVSAQLTNETTQGKIKVKGKIERSCYIHVNGSETATVVFQDHETDSQLIKLTSFCNDESKHKITVSRGDALQNDGGETIPYNVMVNDTNAPNGYTIDSNGLAYEGQIQITLEDAVVPPGSYTDTVCLAITHGG